MHRALVYPNSFIMSEVYDKDISASAIGDTFGRIVEHMKVGEMDNAYRVGFS